jgi:hypothetical protein
VRVRAGVAVASVAAVLLVAFTSQTSPLPAGPLGAERHHVHHSPDSTRHDLASRTSNPPSRWDRPVPSNSSRPRVAGALSAADHLFLAFLSTWFSSSRSIRTGIGSVPSSNSSGRPGRTLRQPRDRLRRLVVDEAVIPPPRHSLLSWSVHDCLLLYWAGRSGRGRNARGGRYPSRRAWWSGWRCSGRLGECWAARR